MQHSNAFYIDDRWVTLDQPREFPVINPATERPLATLALGNATDVNKVVAAARRAFLPWAAVTVDERLALLRRILALYEQRYDGFAEAIRLEMGSQRTFSHAGQAARGPARLKDIIQVLEDFPFKIQRGCMRLLLEPTGVCGLITPWNCPVNQVMVKVAPALAAACTMVMKPSEYSPLSTLLLAEVLHEAGVPGGVFNLVNGDGEGVGQR